MLDFKRRISDNEALADRAKKHYKTLMSIERDPANFGNYVDVSEIGQLYDRQPAEQSSVDAREITEIYQNIRWAALQRTYEAMKDSWNLLEILLQLQDISINKTKEDYDGQEPDPELDEYLTEAAEEIKQTEILRDNFLRALPQIEFALVSAGRSCPEAEPSDIEQYCEKSRPLITDEMSADIHASLQTETCFCLSESLSRLATARIDAMNADLGWLFLMKMDSEFVQHQVITKLPILKQNMFDIASNIQRSMNMTAAIMALITLKRDDVAPEGPEGPKPTFYN